MISNERSSSLGFRPSNNPQRSGYGNFPQKPRVEEDTLKTETIQVERKSFTFTLKENPRGRFLRITEDVNGRRDNVIIPATGLEEFQKVVNEMVQAATDLPEGQPPAQPT